MISNVKLKTQTYNRISFEESKEGRSQKCKGKVVKAKGRSNNSGGI